jgi:hypothetical protein
MEKSPAYIKALEAMNQLSENEKLQLLDAIGESLPEVWQEWLERKADAFYESDEEDIRLAEEALAEYRANPETAVPWDEFYKQQLERLKETKAYADH